MTGHGVTGHDHPSRRDAIRAAVAEALGDRAGLLVTSPPSVRWATGFTGSAGALLVAPDGAWLVTDARYPGRAAAEAPDVAVELDRDVVAAAVRLAARADVAVLAFEGDHVSHRRGTELVSAADASGAVAEAVATTGIVEALRATKDAHEVALLTEACTRTEAVLDEVLAGGLVGRTEADVARALEDGFRAAGAGVAFPPIVASGPNGAVPHHAPADRAIEPGDLVTIDCGALVEGYHADHTRTVAAGRRPDDGALLAAFVAVAAAQEAGVASLHDGVAAAAVDAACRAVLGEHGLADAFLHGTGHAVGLEIHEQPILGASATATLTVGSVVTVEPGVYLPGRGGVRIEDTVLVTGDGRRRLTASPRELLVV